MNHALISIFRHRTLQLAALITMGMLAGQHLITEHVLTARHLSTLDHLLIFAVTTLWLLPASLVATVLGLRIARFLGIGVTRWQHRLESAGLISSCFSLVWCCGRSPTPSLMHCCQRTIIRPIRFMGYCWGRC
jgi:hypothetical protein